MVRGPSFAIVDAGAAKPTPTHYGLGAKWLAWELAKQGAEVVSPRDADVVLVSVVSPHEPECVPRALKRVGVEPMAAQRIRQRVVIGGGGAMSPIVFDPFSDLTCVGEGREMVAALVNGGLTQASQLPNAWIPGDSREVIPDYCFPWDAPPTMAEDGIVRVYASRGCRKKCLFCHTGWSMPFSKAPEGQVSSQCASVARRGHRVNVVTNDAADLGTLGAKQDSFSASYSQLRLLSASAKIDGLRQVRIGVEAPSERLRRALGKPVDSEGLLRCTADMLGKGVSVRWFMIAGLPGETYADYDELKECIRLARHAVKKGAIQMSFTAFTPDSSAPLALLPLTDDYHARFQAFWRWFFDGPGFTSKVQLFKCAGPKTRMAHSMASMGASEDRLRKGWADCDPPNWRVRYAYRHVARQACEAYARKVMR